MSVALVRVGPGRIGVGAAGEDLVVVCELTRCVMVAERHADGVRRRLCALEGHRNGNQQ